MAIGGCEVSYCFFRQTKMDKQNRDKILKRYEEGE